MMDCYRQAVWHGGPAASETRIADKDSTFYEVQTFNDKMANTKRMPRHICDLLERTVSQSGEVATKVLRECIIQEAALPNEARDLVKAGKAINAIEDVATRIKCGKGMPTIVDMNECLNNITAATKVCTRALNNRRGLSDAVARVTSEFNATLTGLDKKSERFEAAASFMQERYGSVFKCIKQWNFDELPKLSCGKENADLELQGAAKLV